MRVVIVIPTFNEKKNIEPLVKKILSLVAEARVIIVDDNSPDGTGKIVDNLVKRSKRVEVIHRRGKLGRGSGVIDGFKRGLRDKKINYFVEMDADFSHDPGELKSLMGRGKKFDVVVGSRYLPGSKIINWGITRRIFSKIANFFAKLVLRIPISDYSNGYRCYQRRALEALDFERIESKGYIVLSEIAYKLYKKGFSFGEVPIVFVNRKRGKSNLNFGEVLEGFWSVIKLKLKFG